MDSKEDARLLLVGPGTTTSTKKKMNKKKKKKKKIVTATTVDDARISTSVVLGNVTNDNEIIMDDDVVVVKKKNNLKKKKRRKKTTMPLLPDHNWNDGLVDKFETRGRNQLGLDLESGGNTERTVNAFATRVDTVEVTSSHDKAIADIPMADQEKQGGKFCNCCCDYRRAVIIMSIIFVISNSIDLALLSLVSIVFLCFNIFTLIAAIRYSICMLTTAVFLILIGLGWDIYVLIVADSTPNDNSSEYSEEIPELYDSIYVSVNIFVLLAGLYIYPVVGLISEIKSGIMSPETYPHEEYSCCCQAK